MKKTLTISVEEEDIETLRLFCEKTGLTISSLYEHHTAGLVKAAKLSGMLKKPGKACRADLMKMFLRGVVQDV